MERRGGRRSKREVEWRGREEEEREGGGGKGGR